MQNDSPIEKALIGKGSVCFSSLLATSNNATYRLSSGCSSISCPHSAIDGGSWKGKFTMTDCAFNGAAGITSAVFNA